MLVEHVSPSQRWKSVLRAQQKPHCYEAVEPGFESYEFAPDSLSVWDLISKDALSVCIGRREFS